MKGSRERLHEIIFEADTPAGKRFDVLLLWLIVASVVTVMAETVPDWHDRYRGTFMALEWVFTGLFTIEYITRLLVVKRPLRYATSFSAWSICWPSSPPSSGCSFPVRAACGSFASCAC